MAASRLVRQRVWKNYQHGNISLLIVVLLRSTHACRVLRLMNHEPAGRIDVAAGETDYSAKAIQRFVRVHLYSKLCMNNEAYTVVAYDLPAL